VELRQLRYFVAVARRQHVTAAAATIGVAQPALSQQIRLLERELGLDLFDRAGRRLRLTPAGAALLPRAERVLAEVESAVGEMAEFAGLRRGRLVAGVLPSLALRLLPPLLADFHDRYPGLELALREERSDALLALVEAGEVDLALLHQPATGGQPAAVALEPLFTEELVAVTAPGHPLAARAAAPLTALRDEPLLLSKPGSGIRRVTLDACAAAGFTPHVAFESDGVATLRALAAVGLGVAILPRSEATTAGPPVAIVALTEPALTRTVALAWRPTHYRTPAAGVFLAFVRERLRQHPAGH
jgi:DNA-binding transcriptional LysR family regulator